MSWYQALLGKCSVWFEGFSKPVTPVQRSSEEQASIERKAAYLTLYDQGSNSCSTKVRRHIKWLNLPIVVKDLKRCHIYQKELLSGGGRAQLPCLRIEKTTGTEWLYESEDIIRYLDRRFAPKSKPQQRAA